VDNFMVLLHNPTKTSGSVSWCRSGWNF